VIIVALIFIMALPFRLHGATEGFNSRSDALTGGLAVHPSPKPTSVEQDDDEEVDSIHSNMFHKEHRNPDRWQFYSLEDVQLVTEHANTVAAKSIPHNQQEQLQPLNADGQTFPRSSIQYQGAKNFSKKTKNNNAPRNNKERSIILLDEDGEEELNL